MCVLKAALCVHAACVGVEVARGVYSTSLVVCGDVIGATVEERHAALLNPTFW